MGNFDLHVDNHAGHFTAHHFGEHRLSIEQLHHVQTREARSSNWPFIVEVITLFVLGFGLTGPLLRIASWLPAAN
jgi:uncharacterized membrane protein